AYASIKGPPRPLARHMDTPKHPAGRRHWEREEAPLLHRINVSLRGLRPLIWRRLEVPARITLAGLHAVLQTAFGWTDSHLHGFEVNLGGRASPAQSRARR
ncbi:MAG: IS1096 element passenger TnpR family protein, partial [Dermatophilaceae bacterium]